MQWKNYRYNQTPEGIVITELTESIEQAEIPSYIDGIPVVEIGEGAFSENGGLLTRVIVPETVKRIRTGAFRMCMYMMELELHEGLEVIEAEAFYLTPLTELALPSTVRLIEQPWELGGISWNIHPDNPYFHYDGYGLYYTCENEKELLVVNQIEERKEYPVEGGTTIIGENAMAGNNSLEHIVLPPSVYKIREAAFESCQFLTAIELPEGLREICTNAFSHCIRLKKIHLPASLEQLGAHALSDTFGWSDSLIGLESITVAEGNPHFHADENALFEIGEQQDRYIVKYFGTEYEYNIPFDVTRILPSAFRRSGLKRFSVPKGMTDVGEDAFRECKELEEIYLEESDTVMYVPRQPIYRKDEITALLLSETMELKRAEQEADMEELALPDKWLAFVGQAIYTRKQGKDYDPYEEYVFDYRGYDALFHTYLNLPDHYGMACCRLKYPVLLNESVKQKYEMFLQENLMDIVVSIAESEDMYHLATLAELGFFTLDNIEDCMDICSQYRRTKFMSYLLNYKREHLGNEEFDFDL